MVPKTIYERHGETAVLLLHAYSGSPNDVRMLARFLERANYSVYAPLFTGHGTINPADIMNAGPTKWRQDAQEALTFLKEEGFTKIFVFGLSMGGIFATQLLASNDATLCGGGIFSSPIFPARKSQVPENFILYATELFKRKKLTAEELTARLAPLKTGVVAQLAAIEAEASMAYEGLTAFSCPYFVGQAGLDEMIDPQGSLVTVQQRVVNNLPTTFQWYAKSSHVLTVSQERKKFEEDVLAFIRHCSFV